MKITTKDGVEKPLASVIGEFFRKPGETLQEFMKGYKELSTADKDELARGAAKELGYTVVDEGGAK